MTVRIKSYRLDPEGSGEYVPYEETFGEGRTVSYHHTSMHQGGVMHYADVLLLRGDPIFDGETLVDSPSHFRTSVGSRFQPNPVSMIPGDVPSQGGVYEVPFYHEVLQGDAQIDVTIDCPGEVVAYLDRVATNPTSEGLLPPDVRTIELARAHWNKPRITQKMRVTEGPHKGDVGTVFNIGTAYVGRAGSIGLYLTPEKDASGRYINSIWVNQSILENATPFRVWDPDFLPVLDAFLRKTRFRG